MEIQGAASRRPTPHFMLVPSLGCPARCSYCFGPHTGPVMSSATLSEALDFVTRIAAGTRQGKVKITFHGGEPLLAGHGFWRQALAGLNESFGANGVEIALQSNLWLLDDELCRLFHEHRVEIGTSLDGPQEITDAQRGAGYFVRTMQGVRQAQAHGMTVGCIVTFTPVILPRWREVFDFFLAERLGFSIHPAVPLLESPNAPLALSPEQYARLLLDMLDYYVTHRRELAVASLDQMCRGVAVGQGKVCSFRDCLGMFLAIDPASDIYPCQRFCGRPRWRLGTLAERLSLEQLLSSPVGRRFRQREEEIRQACGGCPHLDYCLGGCPYNAWAGGGSVTWDRPSACRVRDPYCAAYRAVFDHIQKRLLEEARSEENIQAVAERPYDGTGHPLFRKGPLIELARDGPHPSNVARNARRVVAAVELARGPDIPAVATRLVAMGICRGEQSAAASLAALEQRLRPKPDALNNLYLHVTFACQFECTHCYARAGPPGTAGAEMPPAAIESLVRRAKTAGFRQVVISGGEPLIHSAREAMLDRLATLRSPSAPMNLVLRTNLALPFTDDDLLRIGGAFDQVVVSVDGSRETHDARRGRGAYDRVIGNLERYQSLANGGGELSLAAVMSAPDVQSQAGCAVRELASRLGIRRSRFRPLLPLGRAQDWPEPPTSEALGAYADPMELIENGFHPVAACGLGQNLYVEPSGESFPCYAYHQPHTYLGNVVERGLGAVLESPAFRDLPTHTVDTNPKCRECDVRYLCGGACHAWGGEAVQRDLDAPPRECAGLKNRARAVLTAARAFLELE